MMHELLQGSSGNKLNVQITGSSNKLSHTILIGFAVINNYIFEGV